MSNPYPPQQPGVPPQGRPNTQPYPPQAYPPGQYQAGQAFQPVPPPKKPLWKKKRFLIPAGIVALMILSSCLNGGKKEEGEAASNSSPAASGIASATPLSSAAPSQAAAPVKEAPAKPAPAPKEFGDHPADQAAFLAAFDKYKGPLDKAGNELQRAKAITDRDAAMCAAANGGTVRNWTGKITKIGANNDGYAHIDVRMSDDVLVKTWNNAFSDSSDNTLIKPGALYDSLLKLKEGQTVVFSGEFVPGETACLKGTNLTEAFYAADPDLLFRFSAVQAR